jgi:hypothetical protein
MCLGAFPWLRWRRFVRQELVAEGEGPYGFVIGGVLGSVLVVDRGRCEGSSLAGVDAGETGHGRRVRRRPVEVDWGVGRG